MKYVILIRDDEKYAKENIKTHKRKYLRVKEKKRRMS
jgi:hypothetical protein